jgi:hypothetical protein
VVFSPPGCLCRPSPLPSRCLCIIISVRYHSFLSSSPFPSVLPQELSTLEARVEEGRSREGALTAEVARLGTSLEEGEAARKGLETQVGGGGGR